MVLESSAEQAYDDITRLLQTSFNVPIAIVNLLDAQRDWFKSCVGLTTRESPANTSFCEAFFHVVEDLIIAEDTALDPRFKQHPLVIGPPHIRFYAGARLVVDGQTVGTLCAYDVKPKQVSAQDRDQLRLLAAAVIQLLSQRLGRPPV